MSKKRDKKELWLWGLLAVAILLSNLNTGIAADTFPGNPPIVPRWAFEPWVWEDNTNTSTSTEELVQGYIDRNIPVGAVIVDSPWETYYNTFAWDTERYPNPWQMISDFHAQDVKVILWITGFVNTDSPDFVYVKEHEYAVNDGQVFSWWKGSGMHIDFTNPSALDWWHGKMDQVLAMGIDGWKVDCSADKVSNPVSTHIGSISQQEFKRYYYADFYDHTVSQNPNTITVSRAYSSYQGGIGASISKNVVAWNGDYLGNFEGLRKQKDDVYESAKRGYGAPGVEVGGYYDTPPTKHSLIRYAQFGALTPLMENGGRNGGEEEHLPWYWDTETVDIYRYYATLHSELAPYLFSYSVESHLSGESIIRDSDKDKSHHKLGEELFVSILTSNTTSKDVAFPGVDRWIDYWNESTVYNGGSSTAYPVPLDRFPIFIKAGSIIPMSVKNGVTGHGDASSAGKTTLLIYPAGATSFTFHRPTGEGTDYSDVNIRVNETVGTVTVDGNSSQDYRLRVKSFSAPSEVTGADSWGYDAMGQYVVVDTNGQDFTITIAGLTGYGETNPGLIMNMSVKDSANAAGWSIQANIQSGDIQYGDRSYRLDSVPSSVEGSYWIRTANDSKIYTGEPVVTFEVTTNVDVYVAHRDDISPKPSWLGSWSDTGENLTNYESPPKTYSLYKKSYSANGTVSLGPNGGSGQGMYTIIVEPQSDLVISNVTAGSGYQVMYGGFDVGAVQYIDRSYTFDSVPSSLFGATYIKTANNDKNSLGDSFLSFDVNKEVTVYVAHDDRIVPRPGWLSAFEDTGNDIFTDGAGNFSLFRKVAAEGTVTLGGNGGLDGKTSMYTVVITPGVTELVISDINPAGYQVVYGGFDVGTVQYIDRSYTFDSVPSSLFGATYIKTANNDKNSLGDSFLSFDVNKEVTVYVAHDDRIVPRPGWLSAFEDTGNDIFTDGAGNFSLFRKVAAEGTVTLGGNGGLDGKISMYTVVITPGVTELVISGSEV